MRSLLVGPPLAAASLLAYAAQARAEQFVVSDVTYTHSSETTSDSHYRVNPAAGAPSNWQSPINYAMGAAHVRLEVKTKPGATPTKFQICFEGNPSYACTNQSPTYTTTGTYEWTTPFANFYFGGTVNWNQGVNKVALILKDTMNNKPQGDALYVPTDLRVVVTIISPGASFVPPVLDAGTAQDGGSARDAGTAGPSADAGPDRDAGQERDAGAGAAGSDAGGEPDAGASARADAGSALARNERDAGSGGAGSDESEGGCSLAGARAGSPAPWSGPLAGVALAFGWRGRRRARRR